MVRVRLVDPVKSLRHRMRKPTPLPKGFVGTLPKGTINNPLGIGGVKKGDAPRNPTGKGGLVKGSTKSRAAILKSVLVRSGKLDKSMSKRHVRKEKARTVAMEARELQELAKKSMPAAMKRINDISANERSQDNHAIAASVFLAERAYGRPIQPNINASVDNNGKSSEVDDVELNKRIAETIERVARITGGAPAPVKGKK